MPQFLNLISDGVLLGLVYAIAGLGLSLVMGIMGVVNVAHSAFMMLGSFFAFELFRRLGIDPIVSFFLAFPVFFAAGAALYRVVVTRVERAPQTQGLVAMFGLNCGFLANISRDQFRTQVTMDVAWAAKSGLRSIVSPDTIYKRIIRKENKIRVQTNPESVPRSQCPRRGKPHHW